MKTISKTPAPFRQSLISASGNQRVDALEISGEKITPKSPHWSVSKLTLHGGRQEGVAVVVVNNGRLTFTIVPTRGMSVLEAILGDMRMVVDASSPPRD